MTDKLTQAIIDGIEDKKGEDIVVLDLTQIDGAICDTFVIATAHSTVQVGAIAGGVEDKVWEELREKVIRIDGLRNAQWVAMDYGSVMVHIFLEEVRDFYKLEELWADAE